jgi:hypothetical protein
MVAPISAQTNAVEQNLSDAQRVEAIRKDCIQNRRRICGKIIKILRDGLVVDSGYMDLMRPQLNGSWLIDGSVEAHGPGNVIEEHQSGSVCIGLVFLADLPKTPKARPKAYDYVNLEAFPAGPYSYESVGNLRRTVRKFSAKLSKAVEWKLDQADSQNSERVKN